MRTIDEWKVEHWEDEDYIITGFDLQHPGTFSKTEATRIVSILKLATPLIQTDAFRAGQVSVVSHSSMNRN